MLFEEVFSVPQNMRNINSRVGFHLAGSISNAQNQLHHHACAEDDDFRDGSKPGAVTADSAALSLYPLSRTKT